MDALKIEDVSNDHELKEMGKFLAANLIDVRPTVLGKAAMRVHDTTAVALLVRTKSRVIAALNSVTPMNEVAALQFRGRRVEAETMMHEVMLLKHVAVADRYRGQGHARRLVEEAERRHRSDGVRIWFGQVDDREREALGFYRTLGFRTARSGSDLPGVASFFGQVTSVRSGTFIYKQF